VTPPRQTRLQRHLGKCALMVTEFITSLREFAITIELLLDDLLDECFGLGRRFWACLHTCRRRCVNCGARSSGALVKKNFYYLHKRKARAFTAKSLGRIARRIAPRGA
jgi:hypothetical protein